MCGDLIILVAFNWTWLLPGFTPWGWGNDESVDANCERIFRGKGMFKIYAASDNEFIGLFEDYSATEAMIKDKKDIQIPEELKEILEKSTEDSNPCIVIYEV